MTKIKNLLSKKMNKIFKNNKKVFKIIYKIHNLISNQENLIINSFKASLLLIKCMENLICRFTKKLMIDIKIIFSKNQIILLKILLQ
jgi:hypothetical protein